MNPRWRRFLLLLMIIACMLVHAPRLHQMQAKSVSPRFSAVPANQIVKTKSDAIFCVTLQLQPWTFDATPIAPLEPQDLTLYLAKQQLSPPTEADLNAMSHDLSFFSETEFAPPETQRAMQRSISAMVRLTSVQPADFQPRRAPRARFASNYVHPLIVTSSFKYDLATHALDVPVQPTNHRITRHPQTSGDDGSLVSVGEDPDPKPIPGDDGSDTGSKGGGGGSVIGGIGSGVAGLPPPTSNSIPEPTILLPLVCVATLLRRPRSNASGVTSRRK